MALIDETAWPVLVRVGAGSLCCQCCDGLGELDAVADCFEFVDVVARWDWWLALGEVDDGFGGAVEHGASEAQGGVGDGEEAEGSRGPF